MTHSATALRVIGAGMPRTGTTSLKSALERLLGQRCYHMLELFEDFDAGLLWLQALEGDRDALHSVLANFGAAVDWPASLFWRELRELYPEAIVVLSHRDSAEEWWDSVNRTVWATMRRPDQYPAFAEFNTKMRIKAGLGDDWDVPSVAKRHYQDLFDEVVATVPPDQLVVWRATDGWEPLCAALDVPVPEDDFFHLNTSAEFRDRANLTDD